MLHGFAVPLDSVLGIVRVESVDTMRFQRNKVWVVHAEDMRCALRLPNALEAPLVDVPIGNVSASVDVHVVFARIVVSLYTFITSCVCCVMFRVFNTDNARCACPNTPPCSTKACSQ